VELAARILHAVQHANLRGRNVPWYPAGQGDAAA
jgi:hypothetical protein